MKFSVISSALACTAACAISALAAPTINKADFDRLNLGLNFELLELELFNLGIDIFVPKEWEDAGYGASFVDDLKFMRDQEVQHAAVLQQILKGKGAKPCEYQFPKFETVDEFLNFSSIVTSVGEAGYLGFTFQLNNRSSILTSNQIFTTEARQNARFRSARKLNSLNANFDTPLTESQSYTLNAPYIKKCPDTNPPIPYTVFPQLNATISKDQKSVTFYWDKKEEKKDQQVHVAWVNQLAVTFTDLKEDGSADIPDGVIGNTFGIITSKARTDKKGPFVRDSDVIAGPVALPLRTLRNQSDKDD
ncbi:Rds1 protein [Fimicolochytrium jonesii]|uniref:Rds1 protein n=1 Tax=Fimicolochytrium jonesii TaxID=1396493 RepID=UPI0022FEC045|nr:Rds1 protein [Fimicolochytrium jonesii]KAI8817901.1 Rds1 protein [Fimicolochytrium jonesii]